MSYYCKKNDIPTARVVWNGIRNLYCPYCNNKIKNHEVSDYGKDEIHPCEHCGKNILWTPLFDLKDLRD